MCKIVVLLLCVCFLGEVLADKKLIVVLIDGVRWDYINDPKLKGIPRIIENGVKAPYVVPVYPSLSYPNYQSIATGLYPEYHGFVDNTMYENETGRYFAMIPNPGSADPHWWNEAEPIWITVEKRGKTAAVYWWAGCEVEIMGNHPTICERQRFGPPNEEETMDFLERIDDVVEMFKPSRRFPKDRLSLALFYYGGVDYAGHASGPTSPQVKEALYDIDNILDKMQSKLKKAGLEDEVNIMVVADHGMTDVNEKVMKYISLEKFAPKIKYQVDSGAQSMILPLPGKVDELYEEMKKENIEGLQVYKKQDIPEYYHLRRSSRLLPIYLMSKKGYLIKQLEDEKKRFVGPHRVLGTHGYDPAEVEDMRTIFFASGPDFRKGVQTEVLSTLDLYNIMCSILEVEPLPNNGSFERVNSMLEASQPIVTSSAAGIKRSCFYVCFVLFAVFHSMVFRPFF